MTVLNVMVIGEESLRNAINRADLQLSVHCTVSFVRALRNVKLHINALIGCHWLWKQVVYKSACAGRALLATFQQAPGIPLQIRQPCTRNCRQIPDARLTAPRGCSKVTGLSNMRDHGFAAIEVTDYKSGHVTGYGLYCTVLYIHM